ARGAAAIAAGLPSALAQDVAAASDAIAGELVRALEDRKLLAGQREGHRTIPPLEGDGPRGDRLVAVAGPDEPQVRHRAQGRVVLDRLVRWAVLAEADRVVGPDVDHVEARERRE